MCALGTGVQTCALPIFCSPRSAAASLAGRMTPRASATGLPAIVATVSPAAASAAVLPGGGIGVLASVGGAFVAGAGAVVAALRARTSVVEGTRVSVRVDLGCRRITNKKNKTDEQ